jgi:hypothetical protein
MPLNTNMPLPSQTLGQTNNLILQNFNNIQANFVVNHVSWNSGADSGKHTYVTMPAQSAPPVTAAYEQSIFCQNDTASNPQLWIQPANSAAPNAPYNITGFYKYPSTPWAAFSRGTTTLTSGIILKWGQSSVNAGSGTVSFLGAGNIGPFPNTLFSILFSPKMVIFILL